MTIYNPLSRPVSQYIRLPVTGSSYTVTDPNGNCFYIDLYTHNFIQNFILGNNLETQIVPLPESVLNMPGRESSAVADLVFKADALPPLGFKSFYVKDNTNANTNRNFEFKKSIANEVNIHTIN